MLWVVLDTQRVHIVPSQLLSVAYENVDPGDALLICDPDSDLAAATAGEVSDRRTAVFVGDITTETDLEAAVAMAVELFGDENPLVYL